jgi:hypothetical protein
MTASRVDVVYRPVPVADPSVGAEFSITPRNCAGWLIRHLKFLFTTSAVAANRAPMLTVDDGTNVYARFVPAANQAASLAVTYAANPGSSRGSATGTGTAIDWPTDGLWLPQGHVLRSVTDARDGGDQFSAIAFVAIEFPTTTPLIVWPLVNTFMQATE